MIAIETQHAKKSPETGIHNAIIRGSYWFGYVFQRLRQTYIWNLAIVSNQNPPKTSRSGLDRRNRPGLNPGFQVEIVKTNPELDFLIPTESHRYM